MTEKKQVKSEKNAQIMFRIDADTKKMFETIRTKKYQDAVPLSAIMKMFAIEKAKETIKELGE